VLSTAARLLRLLSLLQSQRSWAGADLAERLEITPRTVRRDVDRLRSLGYPIEAQSGVAGGYALQAGAHLPPLALADDEALAIALALRTATNALSASIGEAALRALAKLERVFPARLRRRAHALRDTIFLLERAGSSVDTELLTLLAEACDGRCVVAFGYTSRASTRTERVVEPAGLVHTGRWYLVAFDRDRDDWRTFRVDRIADGVALGATFTPRPLPELGDLRGFVSRSLSVAAYPHQVVAILHAPAEQVAARLSPSTAMVERLGPQRTQVSLGASSLVGLAAWIASFEVDFEVVEPPELIEALRVLRLRIDRALDA
jgi:predicted DNA-binding transcriptional regulator YafY